MAQIVYTRTENSKSVRTGTLFQGQKFWISQRVPSRKYFIEQVEVSDRGYLIEDEMKLIVIRPMVASQ